MVMSWYEIYLHVGTFEILVKTGEHTGTPYKDVIVLVQPRAEDYELLLHLEVSRHIQASQRAPRIRCQDFFTSDSSTF